MFKATVIEENEHGIIYELGGQTFIGEDYGDIADHVYDYNEDPPTGFFGELAEIWKLLA